MTENGCDQVAIGFWISIWLVGESFLNQSHWQSALKQNQTVSELLSTLSWKALYISVLFAIVHL